MSFIIIDLSSIFWCQKVARGPRQYKTLNKFFNWLSKELSRVVKIHDHKNIYTRRGVSHFVTVHYDEVRCLRWKIGFIDFKILTINTTLRSFDTSYYRQSLSKISNNTKIFWSVLWIKILICPFFSISLNFPKARR